MELEENEFYLEWQKPLEAYIVPIVVAIIFIVGLLGNVMLIIAFLRNRNMRNAPNTFIVSLALADLIVILTCVPFFSVHFTVLYWPYGEAMCKILSSINVFSIAIRPFMLTVLATERFLAIVKQIRLTVVSSIKVAAIFWVLAIICAVHIGHWSHIELFSHAYDYTTNRFHEFKSGPIDVCLTIPETWLHSDVKAYTLTRFVLLYVVPLTVIVGLYAFIVRHLVRGPKTQNEQQQNLANKKVAFIVFVFVVIFVICSLPICIYNLWLIFDEEIYKYIKFLHYLSIFVFCLRFLSLCANPIAFYCLNEQFRKLFYRYILCKCENNQDEQATPMRFQYSKLIEQTEMNQPIVKQETSPTLGKSVTNAFCNEINSEDEEHNVQRK